jgi:hypothetical protein
MGRFMHMETGNIFFYFGEDSQKTCPQVLRSSCLKLFLPHILVHSQQKNSLFLICSIFAVNFPPFLSFKFLLKFMGAADDWLPAS